MALWNCWKLEQSSFLDQLGQKPVMAVWKMKKVSAMVSGVQLIEKESVAITAYCLTGNRPDFSYL